MPDEALDDLRGRIGATRRPSKELAGDRSQGVQLATIQKLARYWTADYDWRACEAELNALQMFTSEIDGVDVHRIHVESPHDEALPLIITHGWPGSPCTRVIAASKAATTSARCPGAGKAVTTTTTSCQAHSASVSSGFPFSTT
jgi:Epoxide hydrolase N terminus